MFLRRLNPSHLASAAAAVGAVATFGRDAQSESSSGESPKINCLLADRSTLLTSPGVSGVFVTYRLENNWVNVWKKQSLTEQGIAALRRFEDRVVVDAYMTRGLSSDGSDLLLRLHCKQMKDCQDVVDAFESSALGAYLTKTTTLVGISKPLNYISTDKSATLNASLFKASFKDPAKYAVVVPVKKSAEWWRLSDKERLALIEEHTQKTLPWLVNVRRKLYHSTGLTDADFVTYFEFNDLETFNNLMIALSQVQENKYHTRWGSPTILATIESDPTAALFRLLISS